KLYADGEIIYDAESDDGEQAKMAGLEFTFYRGTETQDADPLLVAQEGDLQPAYRGVCYIVVDRFPCNPFGRRIPNIEAVIAFATSAIANIGNPLEPFEGAAIRGADFVYDRERNLIYSVSEQGDGTQSLLVHDARTGRLLQARPWLEIIDEQFPDRPARTGLHTIAGATGPYLVAQTAGEGAGHTIAINKDTLTPTGAEGTVSNFRFTRAPDPANGITTVIPRASQLTTVAVPDAFGGFITFVVSGHGGLIFNTGGFGNAILRILPSGALEYVWGANVDLGGGLVSVAVRPIPDSQTVDLLLASRQSNISQPAGIKFWRVNLGATAYFDEDQQRTFFVSDPVLFYETENAGVDGVMRTHYDSATDALIITEGDRVTSVNAVTGQVNWERTDLSLADPAVTRPPVDPSSGYLDGAPVAVVTGDDVVLLDPVTGQETTRQTYNTLNYTYEPGGLPGGAPYIWDPVFNRMVHAGESAVLYGPRVGGSGETLPFVTGDLLRRSGLEESERDVSSLDASALVDGYAIERETAARGATDALGGVYNFDLAEIGSAMVARHRRAAPDIVLEDRDLMPSDGGARLVTERGSALEAPLATTVRYVEAGFEFQESAQTFTRPLEASGSAISQGRASIAVPFVLEPQAAMVLAERATITADLERERISGIGSQRLMTLAPLDTVQINGPIGQGRVLRLERVGRRGDYAVEFEGPEELASLYEPAAAAVIGAGRGTLSDPFIDKPP
ncbi:MAG: phage tail protein, partial [Pseudomonadota bacterium]